MQNSIFTIGNTYKITLDAVVTSGSAKIEKSGGAAALTIDTTKSYTLYLVADRTDLYFNRLSHTTDLTIDNISVKKLNGDPGMTASGATMIKQPV